MEKPTTLEEEYAPLHGVAFGDDGEVDVDVVDVDELDDEGIGQGAKTAVTLWVSN